MTDKSRRIPQKKNNIISHANKDKENHKKMDLTLRVYQTTRYLQIIYLCIIRPYSTCSCWYTFSTTYIFVKWIVILMLI